MHGSSSAAGGQQSAALAWHMPKGWWLKNSHYFMYMMRELSAVFAALWVIAFLWQLPMMAAGPDKLDQFLAWRRFVTSPGWVIFSLTSLVFVLYHTITWFNLMGTVIHVRIGTTRVTGRLVTSAMLLIWAGVTLVVGFVIVTPLIGG